VEFSKSKLGKMYAENITKCENSGVGLSEYMTIVNNTLEVPQISVPLKYDEKSCYLRTPSSQYRKTSVAPPTNTKGLNNKYANNATPVLNKLMLLKT